MADQKQPTIVDIEGVGPIEFPASMTPEEVDAASMKLFQENESTGGKIARLATSPLVPQIAEAADAVADAMDKPRLDRSRLEAQIVGALAGVTQGIGDVASSFTSPVNIAMMLAGLGPTSRLTKAIPGMSKLLELKPIANLQRAVSAIGSGAAVEQGGKEVIFGEDLQHRAMGLAQAAGGAAGLGTDPIVAANAARGSVALGKGMVSASKRPGFIRGTAVGVMGATAASGHPGMAAAGLPLMVLPEAMRAGGRGLIRLGGVNPDLATPAARAKVAKVENAAWEMRAKEARDAEKAHGDYIAGEEKTLRRELGAETKTMDAEQRAEAEATANATRLAKIQEERGDLEAQPPTFAEGLSAKGPGGETVSMRTAFKPKGEEGNVTPGGLSAADRASLVKQGQSPEQIANIERVLMGGGKTPAAPMVSGGPERPPIQVNPASIRTLEGNSPRLGAARIGEARLGEAPAPPPMAPPVTPRNLKMGSQDSITDMVTEITNATKGGIQIDAPKGKGPLTFKDLNKRMTENEVAARAEARGTPEDIPNNPAAQKLEAERQAASTPAPETAAPDADMLAAAQQQATSPLEAAMIGRRMPMEEVPGSKSRRSEMSETNPKLTVEEEQAFGFPAGTKITYLPEAVVEELLNRRRQRSESYRVNAGMDKGATRAYESEK